MTTFLSCFIRFSFVSLLSIAVDTRALHPCGQELLVDIASDYFNLVNKLDRIRNQERSIESRQQSVERTRAEVDAAGHCGDTPLHAACKQDNVECAQLLLEHEPREVIHGSLTRAD